MNISNLQSPSTVIMTDPKSSASSSCHGPLPRKATSTNYDFKTSPPPIFQPMHDHIHTRISSHKNSHKFISTASITLLVIFFLLLRSSAGPFLNPRGEAKKIKSSFFFNATCFLYIWLISVTLVTLIPAFSAHYNGVIAASLFFPMTFSSIAALLMGRFCIRLIFYVFIRCHFRKQTQEKKQNTNQSGSNNDNDNDNNNENAVKRPIMIAFHRPFRKLAKNAMKLSGILCLLYAHCWSRTLSLFNTSTDGSPAICRAVFTPFVRESDIGANENCIWYFWSAAIFTMIISFAQDEWNGLHYRKIEKGDSNSNNSGDSDSDDDEDDLDLWQSPDEKGDEKINNDVEDDIDVTLSKEKGGRKSLSTFLSKARQVSKEEPEDTLGMVPWLSLFAASSIIDIFLQNVIFRGRVDARSMQSALQRNSSRKDSYDIDDENSDQTDEEKLQSLKQRYQGCIFDYSSELKKDTSGGLWFDFMADCGDGFNSTYQVARMLAQPNISTVHDGQERQLPRGKFLVNGGDLAYPNPSEYSYEKRFFRPFEDAMSPPPSFRHSKIATKKPNLPVKGWNNCFHDNHNKKDKDHDSDRDIHELYKGPSSFIIPGNHDWYDGLATYSRLILCRDWLGGWLLPQKRSYFAIKLQQGWWVLGMDCALSSDIDIEQYKFFADIADNAIGPDDAVIVVNHEPHWVIDFDLRRQDDELSEQNIGELMQTHLKGKVRLRLAGDLHHYTRHVPVRKSSSRISSKKRSRSFSFDQKKDTDDNRVDGQRLEAFTEENRPELIVSGGGGAFLHGTHLYSNNITFGHHKKVNYKRVCAFPSEKVSYFIGSMNLWHYRWRNFRTDWLMALCYFGIVSSLFPLCGIYEDYEAFNPRHDLYLLILWSLGKIGGLMWRIVTSENVSLFWSCVVLMGGLIMQAGDIKMHPAARFSFALCHGLAHIIAALSCLLFVQSVTEWIVQTNIVNLSVDNQHFNGTHLASSLYENYKTHFFPVLENYTNPDSPNLAQYYAEKPIENEASLFMFRKVLEFFLDSWKWIYLSFPILKTTLSIFDLPGLIAQNHQDICTSLCANGLECLLAHDKYRFLTIERTSYLKYMIAISLYFFCVAIPLAGGIFGSWLTVTSNVFKSQSDLSFSALMVEHWKNFLKLHIKANGDLEVFAIGLQRVPTKWIKDGNWSGRRCKKQKDEPSWSWKKPSKWTSLNKSKAFRPQIVDYTCVQKRQINTPPAR